MGYMTRIRELREAKGLSMAALGERCGTTAQQIERLEKDQRGVDIPWLRRLASGLGVAPADILADADNPDRLRDRNERSLLATYRDMDDAHRASLLAHAMDLLRAQRGELTEAEWAKAPEPDAPEPHSDAGTSRKDPASTESA